MFLIDPTAIKLNEINKKHLNIENKLLLIKWDSPDSDLKFNIINDW